MSCGNKQPVESVAIKTARFFNEEIGLKPSRVNQIMEVLREHVPAVLWDIPEEQEVR